MLIDNKKLSLFALKNVNFKSLWLGPIPAVFEQVVLVMLPRFEPWTIWSCFECPCSELLRLNLFILNKDPLVALITVCLLLWKKLEEHFLSGPAFKRFYFQLFWPRLSHVSSLWHLCWLLNHGTYRFAIRWQGLNVQEPLPNCWNKTIKVA